MSERRAIVVFTEGDFEEACTRPTLGEARAMADGIVCGAGYYDAMMAKKKVVVPPTLPGEVWRGTADFRGESRLCAVALPDAEVERWTYLEFGPDWPTVAVWFVDRSGSGDWIPLDESEQGFVYAACIRALRATAKETGR